MSENQQQQMKSKVILVDKDDNPIGEMDKYTSHRTDEPHLHRAFSLFLFDSKGRLLIQQRAATKLTFPSIWANTCCSHPEPNEDTIPAAIRRTNLELNIKLDESAKLQELGVFKYRAQNGEWTEWEVDHVIFGFYDVESVDFDKDEVSAIKWVTKEEFNNLITTRASEFSVWIQKIWAEFLQNNWDEWVAKHHIDESKICMKVIDLE